jgi:SAM-dependent methyltransferase
MSKDGTAAAISNQPMPDLASSGLTAQTYWDGIHAVEQQEFSNAILIQEGSRVPLSKRITRTLKRALGPDIVRGISAYDDHLLWDVILPEYLPDLNGCSSVEIGSAPGDYSVQFCKRHGCIPYGVEYSTAGVDINRDVFRQNGFDPDNVIHADFFSDHFLAQHREKFDVVMSKGFIEHFEEVKPVIDRHMQLLKPGGYLIVTVPNLRGANYWLGRLFDEGAIARHNISIMRKAVYRKLFDDKNIKTLFCDYYGTFSFYLFTAGRSVVKRHLLWACHRLQPILNLGMRTIFGDRGAETSTFSPSLLYIGRKSASAGVVSRNWKMRY